MQRSLAQRQEMGLAQQFLGIRLSELLELPESQYRRLTAKLERDPLYGLLTHPPQGKPALRRRPWPGAIWRPQGLAWEGEIAAAAPPEAPEAPPPELLALMQRIGREKVEQLFLYNEGPWDAEAVGRACGIRPEQAQALADYLDGALLADADRGLAPSEGVRPRTVPAFATVAAFEPGPDGFSVAYFSAHYARGQYHIDYDGVEALKRSGVIARSDWKALRALLAQLENANAKLTVLGGLLRLAAARQSRYLASGDALHLEALTQKEAAADLAVSPSAVSRALSGRAVRLPWGEERPLAALFPSRRAVAVAFVADALGREPSLSARILGRRLSAERGIRVTRRAVNLYRREALREDARG